MKKLATIEIFHLNDELAEKEYQDQMIVELTLDVETPFGVQKVKSLAHINYANTGKSPAGRFDHFKRATKEGINECLTKLKANLLSNSNTKSS